MELRLASEGMASLRGGILSLIRSKPFASSKLVILCCGENPLIAKQQIIKKKRERVRLGGVPPGAPRSCRVRLETSEWVGPLVENNVRGPEDNTRLLTILEGTKGLKQPMSLANQNVLLQ